MTIEDIFALLSTSGLPVAYHSFPEKNAPQLPFICFLENGTDNMAADGRVYHSVKRITIELYTKSKDTTTEALVETALSGLFWNKSEQYLNDEKCYEIIYDLEV